MTKVPVLNYEKVIRALQRDGWVVVRQRGSRIRLQKHTVRETLKLIAPAHSPIKRSTPSVISNSTSVVVNLEWVISILRSTV